MLLVTLQVMDIHPLYNMLLRRSWIHTTREVTSSLHQYLKYIINRMLMTVKAKEIMSMERNMVIPFFEAEDYNDENAHVFEIINIDCVP